MHHTFDFQGTAVKRPIRTALLTLTAMLTLATLAHAQGKYSIRGIDLMSDVDSIDVFLGDRTPATIQSVPFEFTSPLIPSLPSETNLSIKVAPAGAGIAAAVIDRTFDAKGNIEYEAYAYGSAAAPKLRILERPRSSVPSSGERTLLRVFDASSVSSAFDVYIDSTSGDPLFTTLLPDSATAFGEILGEPVTVILTTAGTKTPVARLIAPIPPGTWVTLVVTGASASNLTVYMLDGRDPAGETTPRELPVLQGRAGLLPTLRAVHALPQSSVHKMDVYLDNSTTPRTSNLIYRSATGIYQGSVGTTTVRFAPAGTSPGEAVLSALVDMREDTAYIVAASQFANGSITPVVLTRYLQQAAPSPGQMAVRVANLTDFFTDQGDPTKNLSVVLTPSAGAEQRFDDIGFQKSTDRVTIASGDLGVKVYAPGATEPMFTGSETIADTGFYTVMLIGTRDSFTVDLLNESAIGAQIPMRSFGVEEAGAPWSAPAPAPASLTAVPNPCRGVTSLLVDVPATGRLGVDVVDLLGRRVAHVDEGTVTSGRREIRLDAGSLAPGHYTCLIRLDGVIRATGAVVVLR